MCGGVLAECSCNPTRSLGAEELVHKISWFGEVVDPMEFEGLDYGSVCNSGDKSCFEFEVD